MLALDQQYLCAPAVVRLQRHDESFLAKISPRYAGGAFITTVTQAAEVPANPETVSEAQSRVKIHTQGV